MTEQTLDRKDLKIMAYKERLSAAQDEIADLRVEVTFLSQQLQEAYSSLAEYTSDPDSEEPSEGPEKDEDVSSDDA